MNQGEPENISAPDPTAAVMALSEHMLAYLRSAALSAAARIGVADALTEGPRTAGQLAGTLKVDAGRLHRLLRYLATIEVFREDGDGRFHSTPMAELLRSDSPFSMRSSVLAFTHPAFWLPAGRLDETVTRGGTVFEDVFGMPFFQYLAADPEAARIFDAGMAAYSWSENPAVLAAYAFPPSGTVVDVGGGHGALLHAVLSAHPGLTGVLFDREPVLRGHRLDDPALRGRWRAVPGDFFESVPAGDLYLLKHILHDWDDDACVRVLRCCRDAMADGGRVLAIDAVIPPGNDAHFGKVLDVQMMSLLDGRERDRADFEAVFARAGLQITRVLPTAGFISIIEATAAP